MSRTDIDSFSCLMNSDITVVYTCEKHCNNNITVGWVDAE